MKLNLIVLTPGNSQGKKIPVNRTPFLIGRDPKCHLRPSSPMVSTQHCSIVLRQRKLYVSDLGSTNGTFLNEVRVDKELEMHHADRLRVGPLILGVSVEIGTPVDQPTPLPPSRAKVDVVDDEAVAAVLLSALDEDAPPAPNVTLQSDNVPSGTTEIQALPPDGTVEMKMPEVNKPEQQKASPAKAAAANTSAAAEELLNKYLRRPRKV
jgi:pSer/pThr/pTyr-binding forkhead associated (FHA) protein